MSDAHLFRRYAKEAMRSASKSTSENEARDFVDLACTWARAASAGEKILGSSFISSPRDADEAAPLTRS
jgi:hypothetical protein